MGHAAVLFDLDNTLYDRDESFRRWADRFARECLGAVEPDARRAAVARLIALDGGGDTSRDELFRQVKAEHPALAAPVAALVAAFYADHGAAMTLDAGTRTLLDALDRVGIPFGIVTNGGPRQTGKVRALGLDRRAACVFVSARFGSRKPGPAVFLAAAGWLGAHPHDTLFVGDNPRADILGAANVGMGTAWLHRGRSWPAGLRPAPDQTIARLDDLLRVARRADADAASR